MAKLHDAPDSDASYLPNEIDRQLQNYINTYQLEYFDDVMCEEKNFSVFYQLSVLSTGLLSWYPFDIHDRVLEIDARTGPLTGILCDRSAHVTIIESSPFYAQLLAQRWRKRENLDIYSGDWKNWNSQETFDIIILNGYLGYACAGKPDLAAYGTFLSDMARLLKPGGRILLSAENRMGLKYICGEPEPFTGRSFDGINKYPKGTEGRSFTRNELVTILNKSSMQYKFYYPLPDDKITQMVYTDDYLPEKNIRERIIPYSLNKDGLIAVEKDLYDDIIDNRVFPVFSNSFLVECGQRIQSCPISYAALSTDRGKDKSFATIVYEKKYVYKKPLFPEGLKQADKLYRNMEELKERAIPVVQIDYDKEGLKMPFINLPTLSSYLKQIVERQPAKCIQIFDSLYEYILKSSETIPAGQNALAIKTEKELDWGPILKKAFIELIPLNCFFDSQTEQILFFDQEYVKEAYPAKFIMFRAIYYFYCFTPGAQDYIPKDRLLERYGIKECWDYFLAEEKSFLKDIRAQEKYKQFYEWSNIKRNFVEQNVLRLIGISDKKDDSVSVKMKAVWNVEMDILNEIKEICEKHAISYFIIHGTLLGAARHKGFIPWDDDLDIGMLRKDYDKFILVAKKELKEPYYLQTMRSDSDCFFGLGCRIRKSDTTGIQVNDVGHKGNFGIWVDILPFDYCVEDEKMLNKKVRELNYYYSLLTAKVYGKDRKNILSVSNSQWLFYRILSSLYSHTKLCDSLERIVRLYTDCNTDNIAYFNGMEKQRVLKKADFEHLIKLEFEGCQLPAPEGYKNILFMMHGGDYMKYPPAEERKPKHRGIIDPKTPYTEYQIHLNSMFENVEGKSIILFGAGMMFEDYMKKWGSRYKPVFIVDNDSSKWGTKKLGIDVAEPKAVFSLPAEKRRIIICSYYYEEIEKQLRKMNVYDYKIYVQKAEWIVKNPATNERGI